MMKKKSLMALPRNKFTFEPIKPVPESLPTRHFVDCKNFNVL
jgi:hypothetical protein